MDKVYEDSNHTITSDLQNIMGAQSLSAHLISLALVTVAGNNLLLPRNT